MSARCCCRGGFTERRRATNRAPISHRIGEKPKSVEALSSEIGVKTDSWPPAGDGRPPMRSAGLMPKSNLGKKMLSAPLSDDVGDRGLCRLAVMESRQMRVAKPDPSASAIGDRGRRASFAGLQQHAAGRRSYFTRGLRYVGDRVALLIEARIDPARSCKPLSERYRAFRGDRCRRDAVAGAASPRGGGRRTAPRSRIASGKKFGRAA